MKRNKLVLPLLAALYMLIASTSFAQQTPSNDVREKLLKIYNGIKNPEISFEHFLEVNAHVYNNQNSAVNSAGIAAAAPQDPYCNKVRAYCTNSDFENGLDQNQYVGAYGYWDTGLYPDPFALTYGFVSGVLTSSSAHQTIVNKSSGNDPIAGISVVPSNGGNQSLRLGNAINGNGTELIAKTITVDANENILGFYYAVVLQDPGHSHDDQPAFSVRAYDCSTGKELPNVCDLGNGSNIAVADANNPFFQSKIYGGENLVWRDWSRVQINLSKYIGKNVIIVFNVKDCNLGGHFGYAYLDNLFSSNCLPPPEPGVPTQGDVMLAAQTDTCGTGNICVKYKLPYVVSSNGTTTVGNDTISLDIYQNGNLVKTLTSPKISTYSADSIYCFSINPTNLGINTSLGGFDYTITGRFTLSGYILSSKIIGNPGTGVKSSTNNDYKITCDSIVIIVDTPHCPQDTTFIANPVTCKAKVTWLVPSGMFPDTISVANGVGLTSAYLIYKGTFNGHGYYQSTNEYTWPDASSTATSVGAHLITITSVQENSFVLSNLDQTYNYAWIGLHNTGTVGSFAWVTGEPLGYTNWIPGEPDNLWNDPTTVHEPYVHINGWHDNTNRWNDIGANVNARFLAEYDSAVITRRQISGPTNGDSLSAGIYNVCYERTNTATGKKDTCCFKITVVCNAMVTAAEAISAGSGRIGEAGRHTFNAVAYPNPTNTSFSVKLNTDNLTEKVRLTVVDVAGRTIETKSSIAPGNTLTFGSSYVPGTYLTTITQGSKTIIMKLVKQ